MYSPLCDSLLQFQFSLENKAKFIFFSVLCFCLPFFDVIFHARFFFRFILCRCEADAINLNPIIRQSAARTITHRAKSLQTVSVSVSVAASVSSWAASFGWWYTPMCSRLILKSIRLTAFCFAAPLALPPWTRLHTLAWALPFGQHITLRQCSGLTRCMKCLNWCWAILPDLTDRAEPSSRHERNECSARCLNRTQSQLTSNWNRDHFAFAEGT